MVSMSEAKIKELINDIKDYIKNPCSSYISVDYFDVYKKILKCIEQLEQENTNLRQALNEIREYIAKDIQKCTYGQVSKYQNILQIIDKVDLGGKE